MAENEKSGRESTEIPVQTDELRDVNLSRAPTGSGTATGQAIADRSGEEAERISSIENRGSPQEVAGGDSIKADFAGGETSEPIGLQAEPAQFAVNGTLNPAMVASPTGLVPVGAVATSPEDAVRRVEENLRAQEDAARTKSSLEPIDERLIDRLSAPELRAIAFDRGYDVGQSGGRVTRERFKHLQAEDKRFSDRKGAAEADEEPSEDVE